MSRVELPRDHWVSRGYQQNFANAVKRVAVFDVAEERVTDIGRPIKSNFVERGFTTFDEAGVPNDLLEKAFASVESRVLNEIRAVSASRCGAAQKADVANLFAVHLVRSPSFKDFHRHIGDSYRHRDLPELASDPELAERFVASEGRQPRRGEIHELVTSAYDDFVAGPMNLVRSMVRQHDQMAGMLNRFHLQVIELEPRLPGFVLADTPVVHAAPSTGRYGFRDRLALGDASLIIGPLTRRTAACFTAKPLNPVVIKTRKRLDAINGVFLRAALAEVVCHPDDAQAIRLTHLRRDRRPPSMLTGS